MSRPLVVDLDGTLIRSDILLEAGLSYARKGIDSLLKLPYWIMQGKAPLKECLALQVPMDVAHLPYNEDVIEFLKQAKQEYRHIVLATASHRLYADQIAEHLGLFNQVIATEGTTNLSAGAKRDRLIAEFGEKGFDYIGNSHDDLPVWAAAEKAYLADPEAGVQKKANKISNVEGIFVSRNSVLKAWFRALRPYQWLKNMLIFIPLLAAHQIFNTQQIVHSVLAFVFFSLAASSGYLFNDLLDINSDRHHPRKKFRPLASGDLPIHMAMISAPLMFVVAFYASLLLMPVMFSISLVIYYALTIAYSQSLKRMIGVDTIVLAGLYTVRIVAGSYACGLIPTFWILAFSMFLFLSLAMVKRYSELLDARKNGNNEKTMGRGYFPADLEIIANLGVSSGYLSVLVLALYVQDVRTIQMYHAHELIWLACPILLFWISRVWMITHRGLMHDDPVLFAIKDKVSLLTGALFATVFVLATMF
ncbi:MAG TPA: UbiA family prenyltransferase [Chlorobaculum sp.]|jgi:4-hydroxybenzoate polyprenyltransferase|nr:UbiA family prenyltransferase [Chlorobaculum sp.]